MNPPMAKQRLVLLSALTVLLIVALTALVAACQPLSSQNVLKDGDGHQMADWPIYTSPTEGFSFRYPPEWKIEEYQSGAVELAPTSWEVHGKISIGYLLLEIEETETLAEWADEYFRLELGAPYFPRELLPGDLELAPSAAIQEQVLMRHGPRVPGGGYLIRNGRYVLSIVTFSNDISFQEVLKPLAESVVFSEVQPAQMRSFQGMPQDRRTITAWKVYEQ